MGLTSACKIGSSGSSGSSGDPDAVTDPDGATNPDAAAPFKLSSVAFAQGGKIPAATTKSYAMVLKDNTNMLIHSVIHAVRRRPESGRDREAERDVQEAVADGFITRRSTGLPGA